MRIISWSRVTKDEFGPEIRCPSFTPVPSPHGDFTLPDPFFFREPSTWVPLQERSQVTLPGRRPELLLSKGEDDRDYGVSDLLIQWGRSGGVSTPGSNRGESPNLVFSTHVSTGDKIPLKV